MNLLRLLLSCAAAFCLGGATTPDAEIRYMVTPLATEGAAAGLKVEVQFRGDADGETLLHLPNEWAGASELWRNVTALSASGATIADGGGPASRILRHRPDAPIRLSYIVTSPYQADPGFDYEKARPMVRSEWFFFHGEGVFAIPDDRRDAPATFHWGKLPTGWKAASDLDHLATRGGTLGDISESVAIGGANLKLVEAGTLRLAMLGDWNFTADALAGALNKVMAAEHSFWSAEAKPFLVAVAPLGLPERGRSTHGTGRTDAFAVASTNNLRLDEALPFLAHEYGHRWFPRELGTMPDNEATDYWFSEGFNDYLTARLLLRSGLWSLQQFIDNKNEVLARYAASPARNFDAEQMASAFWTDPDAHQMAYDRGHLLGLLIEGRIRAKSSGSVGLDDILLAQHAQDLASRADVPHYAISRFAFALAGMTDLDPAIEVDPYSREGRTITLPQDMFGTCARIVTTSKKAFHRGYDADATAKAGGMITGVLPNGPAYAAGMRDGMRLVRREFGTLGDSSVEIGYRVEAGGAERVIRYFPAGEEDLAVQHLALTEEGALQKDQCLQIFARS